MAGLAPAVEGEADPASPAFGRILVGIEGLARLWGDEASLVGAGTGPGRGAHPLAATGRASATRASGRRSRPRTGRATIPAGGQPEEAAFLAPLPLALLPADGPTLERFRIFGPDAHRGAGGARPLGGHRPLRGAGGDLHDLAQGLDGRPLRPRRPVQRLSADVELDPPVETLEPLRFVLHHLCGTLCEQLAARGAGAARATLTLTLEDRGPARAGTSRRPATPVVRRYEQALPEPAAAPDLLERLLMARLEVGPPACAVERLALELDGTAPEAGRSSSLFEPQLARAGRLEWQLRSLAIRFGADRILRASLGDHEALVAERRFDWGPAAALGRA